MFYTILHRLAKDLKNTLAKRSALSILTIKDHVEIFCGHFEGNNAFEKFKELGIEKDRMHVTVFFTEHQKIIYLERQIRIENEDETYQLQLELYLDLPFNGWVHETYEIERDLMGDFHNFEKGYMHFSDHVENMLASGPMIALIEKSPNSVFINLNADL